jgi:Xaa-Pro dipeptidase
MANIPGLGWASPASFQLGRGKTLAIPMEIHVVSRNKLLEKFRSENKSGVVVLEGGKSQTQYDSDTDVLFRQDSWFNYLFGVKEPDMFAAISLRTGRSVLFIPKLSPDYAIWCGEIYPPSYFQFNYTIDDVLYLEDLDRWVADELAADDAGKVFLLDGINSDSGVNAHSAEFASRKDLELQNKVDMADLFRLLTQCRVIKSPLEIEAMR